MDKFEASRLTGKSVKTIERWQREGVNIADHSALLDYNGAGRYANPSHAPKNVPAAKESKDWRSQVQATDDYGQKVRIIQNAHAAKRAEIESLPPNQRWGQLRVAQANRPRRSLC